MSKVERGIREEPHQIRESHRDYVLDIFFHILVVSRL